MRKESSCVAQSWAATHCGCGSILTKKGCIKGDNCPLKQAIEEATFAGYEQGYKEGYNKGCNEVTR